MADGVLRDLHEHPVAGLQCELDAARLVLLAVLGGGVPVDFAGVQHGVAAAADVDEGGLHAGQHVLHATEVHVADERGILVARDVVLHEHAVLQHADLDAPALRPHDHLAVDRLAAREELGLGDHRTPATGVAPVAAALLLRLEAGGALDLLRLGDELGLAGLAHLDDGVGGLVACGTTLLAAAAAGAAAHARRLLDVGRALALGSLGPLGALGAFDLDQHRRGVEDQRGRRERRGDGRRVCDLGLGLGRRVGVGCLDGALLGDTRLGGIGGGSDLRLDK